EREAFTAAVLIANADAVALEEAGAVALRRSLLTQRAARRGHRGRRRARFQKRASEQIDHGVLRGGGSYASTPPNVPTPILPPLMTMPTFLPASCGPYFFAAASGAAPDPSARLCVRPSAASTPAAISASSSRTISSSSSSSMPNVRSNVTRVAIPSANVLT